MTAKNNEKVDDDRGDLGAQVGLTPRSYQLEMLEESMRHNIIIAMDTGSGKTLIAILRIQAELERCAMEKLVWFCVPTVALAEQQHRAMSGQLTAYQSRVLSGKDNCEFWTKKTWTEVLSGTRICVSTHAILLEALTHGFVQMGQIALLVFDEAHNATRGHPANMIMQKFYHPAPKDVQPSILGLTASPAINDQVHRLNILESNLNAISRTPKLHRSELLRHVHQPQLIQVTYRSYDIHQTLLPSALQSLQSKYDDYDLNADPWIVRMQNETDSQCAKWVMKATMKQKTWCREQILDLCKKAKGVAAALGTWATNLYIHQCIQRLRIIEIESFAMDDSIHSLEKLHLQDLLDSIEIVAPAEEDLRSPRDLVSPRVKALIDFLEGENAMTFTGLVFVQTRAEVAVLSQLLMAHPSTKQFTVGTFVGESNYLNRSFAVGELADIRNQKTTLDDLRQRKTNLIVTTNALEEGIDVSACNVVVCFEKPPNLKSFVQRRGRARKESSKYAILLEEAEAMNAVSNWVELEALMREIYADDMRQLHKLQELEDEDIEDSREIHVQHTGAKMGLVEAVSHLYHFCNTLAADRYVSLSPMFFYENHSSQKDSKKISAKVVLPSCVDASVREAHSKKWWTTEKNARRDAAFEAYLALYQAGLVNDNLLPAEIVDAEEEHDFALIEKRPNLAEVDEQMSIWPIIAKQWQSVTEIQQAKISIHHAGNIRHDLNILLPSKFPVVEAFRLHFDSDIPYDIIIEKSNEAFSPTSLAIARKTTSLILGAIFGTRMSSQEDFTTLLVPAISSCNSEHLKVWLDNNSGSTRNISRDGTQGLVRDMLHSRAAYILLGTRYTTHQEAVVLSKGMIEPERASSELLQLLEVKRLPKKLDLLHGAAKHDHVRQGSGIRYLFADSCEIDNLPYGMAMTAAFVPSVLHNIHKVMLVGRLCTQLLPSLDFQDQSLVTSAVSAPSACEPTNYQRLEFLGDSILKLLTTMTLMVKHLIYDEGRLSHKKDKIVSNKSLSNAAIKLGLSPFILTKPFTGKKWRPIYVSTVLDESLVQGKREMSTKTLADVVESLIGAAFQDGGFPKAIQCLKIFLPDVEWTKAIEAHQILIDIYDRPIQMVPSVLFQTEEIIGYAFTRKLLIFEAVTHASYQGLSNKQSYQRLEFLGDSILDNIVTTTAFRHKPPIPVHRLHLIRSGLVNGHFLGYLCMRLSTSVTRTETKPTGSKTFETFTSDTTVALWQMMRHSNTAMSADQLTCLARFNEINDDIATALLEGRFYPWTLLARLEPPKPFSDMIESIIAAIWIDSHGSLIESTAFLERLGLMSYLRRVLESEDLALLHPKEELGQLADREEVKYTISVGKDEGERKRLSCKVHVGEREVVEVQDGLTRMEVETRAADEACKIFRREGRELGKGKEWREDVKRGDEGIQEEEKGEGEDEDEALETDEDKEDGGVDVTEHVMRDEGGESALKGRKRRMEDDCEHDCETVDNAGNDENDNESDEGFLSAEE